MTEPDMTDPGALSSDGATHARLHAGSWKRVDIEHRRLELAVEQSADTVVVTDRNATIVFVNPAFERTTGYRADEVIGQNPRILQSGETSAKVYASMWSTLTSGRPWHGDLVNRRRDGRRLIEEVSISPLFDESGEIVNYVGVKRDVTAARELAARLDLREAEGAAVSATIAGLGPGATLEETAARIVERAVTLAGVTFAGLVMFEPNDRIRTLAAVAADDVPALARAETEWTSADRARIRWLRRRLKTGTVIEHWSRQAGSTYSPTYDRLGVRAMATAPIYENGRVVGSIRVCASGPDAVDDLEALRPTLAAFAALGAVLLAPQLDAAVQAVIDARPIQALITARAFRPVFQPIVSLTTGAILGYEALTRFRDGASPEVRFAQAASAGLGTELEMATIGAQLDAARTLPTGCWLDLNVSGDALTVPEQLAYLIWKSGKRPIVLEITEHERIADYARMRERIAALGIPVRLAVDDAGAGFASMRHILELRPDFIKLDRSLIAGIDSDPARQALVAGLHHFASSAGARLVAEGIETRAELVTLRSLGADLGQGYLLGRPESAARVAREQVDEIGQAERRDQPTDAVHRVKAILWEADGTDERMTFVSEGARSLTGHAATRWMTEPRFWEDHVHPDDRERVIAAMESAILGSTSVSLEYRFRTATGEYRWYEDLVEVIAGPDGHARVVGVMIDVTDRHELEQELAWQSHHDGLTGALNRQGFLHQLGGSPGNAAGDALTPAVIFLDLDHFKAINDSLGHEAGDAVLRTTAARLRGRLRDGDALGRFGGDEFLVALSAGSERDALQVARRLVDAASQPIAYAGRSIPVAFSAGLALIGAGESADDAIGRADRALYDAKRGGGRRVAVDGATIRAAR